MTHYYIILYCLYSLKKRMSAFKISSHVKWHARPCNWDNAERNICKGQMHGLIWLIKITIEVWEIRVVIASHQSGGSIVSKTFTSFTCTMCVLILWSIKKQTNKQTKKKHWKALEKSFPVNEPLNGFFFQFPC